jgi:hypothetical protein
MEVALYIYVDENVVLEDTLTVDNTLITADDTNITADMTGYISNQVVNVVKRIELFNDEKISITSSIQNVNDISKVFTDYSQSFTIPASDNNNEIFRHWYENALDNGFDQRVRYRGYIEIDTQVFRTGLWQLESSTIKNNRVEDYKITFYGVLKSLTDKFGEDKLKDIAELNDYTIGYNGNNVQNTITSTLNPDVAFPLITSNRVWQYGDGGANDISQNSHHIHYYELFPALKLKRIFDAIQNKYNINFNGNFLTQTRFTQAYLWLKNSEQINLVPKTEKKLVELIDESGNDFFSIQDNTLTALQFTSMDAIDAKFKLTITFTAPTNSTLYVYRNGLFYTSINGAGTTVTFNVNQLLLPADYQFFIQTELPTTFTANALGTYFDLTTYTTVTLFNTSVSSSIISDLDLTTFAPDIKVADFFSGILKMFNLTAFSYDEETYTLEQLENWYYQGRIVNFTEYCVTDFDYERIKPYKKINFTYEKSESLLNRAFYDNTQKEYGNLDYQFNTDGADYSVKLPFENLLFNKFTDTNLQVGYAIKTDYIPYKNKPIILYLYKNVGCSFYFNDGTTTNHITNYNVFGQDVEYQNLQHSLNWGIELSSYSLTPVNNSLFFDYYFDYLNNLYSLKSRMVKVSMRLPYSELLALRLNDRIVIRDKRYIINSFTTDLDTFESKFELIQDFRSLNFNNTITRQTNNIAQTLKFDTVSNEPLTWNILHDPDGQIITITNSDNYVEVSIKANTSGVEKIYSIESNNNDVIVITQDA